MSFTRPRRPIRSPIRSPIRAPLPAALLRDERGVAALELAMVAPLMILMFFGMVELGQGLVAARRVTHATGSLGDLVAQEASTSPSDLANSFAAATDILNPLPPGTLQLRVSSVTMNAAKQRVVDWSQGNNGWVGYPKGVAVPTGVDTELKAILVNPGDTIVLSESTYSYASPIGYVLPNGLTVARSSFLRPRQGTVTCPTC